MKTSLARAAGFTTLAALIAFSCPATRAADATLPASALLNRITWGVNAADWRALQRQGQEAWLQAQLHPRDDGLPAPVQGRIAAMRISREPLPDLVFALEDRRRALAALPEEQRQAERKAIQQELAALGREAAARSLLRDIYSRNGLQEQLTWFWMNRFNVFAGKADLRALVGDYEETAIRPHALGKFRDLLAATVTHPAMLRYLDNERNAANHLNENYARELMELHTLGVDGGYTQNDVQELARILTGVGVARNPAPPPRVMQARAHAGDYLRRGLFEFNPMRHDYGDKLFLGKTVHGAGFAEVEQAIDRLASHPATARHVSADLARFFLGADASPPLLQAMARRFVDSDGDIAAVLDTLFHAPEFRASLGHGFKDPVHYLVSAMRLLHEDDAILNAEPLQGALYRLGEPLYGRQTPDGYPLDAASWSSPAQMTARFDLARAFAARNPRLFRDETETIPVRPPLPRIAPALYREAIDAGLGPATRQALARADSEGERLAFLLSSPEFMQR
jgi:uncharacterized protein (DUF1800 family)